MEKWERNLNGLLIVILSIVLLSAFGVQLIGREEPCPLCLLQRIGMIGVAAGAAMNMWFGVRMAHYGLSILNAIFGGFVALRQISLHVCPGFPQFGIPILGLSLYTWSFIVFVCSVLAIALLLFLYDPEISSKEPPEASPWGKFATALILIIAVANIFTTLLQCGLGPCSD